MIREEEGGAARTLRIERRVKSASIGLYRSGFLVIGLLIGALIVPLLATDSYGAVMELFWLNTFGSSFGIQNTLLAACPLILAGTAAYLPLRLGLWNVGIDGQMIVGAWFAAALALAMPDLSGPVMLPLMLIAALLGGAVWMLVPAMARVYLGVNEIVTTFLLNFAASAWLVYWATGPWKSDLTAATAGFVSQDLPSQGWLPTLNLGEVSLHWGFAFVILVPLVLLWVFRSTKRGYEMSITGASSRAAVFAGIPAKRITLWCLLASGAIGGLAGAMVMMGELHAYSGGITNNTGFAALVIAVLAGRSASGVVAAGLLYAFMLTAGAGLGAVGLGSGVLLAVVGFGLLCGAVGDAAARYKIVLR